MKLKAGKSEYRVEDIGQVWRVTVTNAKGEKRQLRQCAMQDIPALRRDYGEDAVGTPAIFAHDLFETKKHKLIFFPAPATDMDAEVEYFPPRKVM